MAGGGGEGRGRRREGIGGRGGKGGGGSGETGRGGDESDVNEGGGEKARREVSKILRKCSKQGRMREEED